MKNINNKIKEYDLKVLDTFASICDENKLDYFLAYGTLIGAIRHKGFIPWDDDIDVYMKPEDYYKFKDIMLKRIYKNYFYQCLETERYYFFNFNKLRMNNTKVITEKLKDEPIHHGIYIDIFPLTPYPNEKADQKKLLRRLKIINLLIEADLKDKTKYNNYGRIGKMISKICRIIPRKFRNKIACNLQKKNILYKKDYNNYYDVEEKIIFDKKMFQETKKVVFENKEYNAPKRYDEYLSKIYGDYMTPPKEKDRIGHNFIEVKFENESDIVETKN